MTSRKNSEAVILSQKYYGNAINNDAELLKSKGIKSPCFNTMYAVVIMQDGKLQRWFRTSMALEKFMKQVNEPYKVRYINTEKHEKRKYERRKK